MIDRKIWARMIALLLGLLLYGGWAMAAEAERDRYDLAIDVLFEEQALRITQTVDYTNRTGQELHNMMFCVYGNILRRQSAIPVESDDLQSAYPAGFTPGGVDFIGVQVNEEDAEWGVQGENELFLRVECDLQPGERARFTFEFYVLWPVYSGAMGVGDLTWRLVNFYPVAAVWDGVLGDFPLGSYTAMTEPLFSETADYHATISLPETYDLAAPGTVTETPDGNGLIHYEIDAESIRELAMVFSRKMFERTAELAGGLTVRALGNTAGHAAALLSEASGAMEWMESALGEYPWETLTLVETEYLYEGLSHPGVIQVSTEAIEGGQLHDAILNLCAHQYFSGVVGSNRTSAPWLSDTLSAYMVLLNRVNREGDEEYLKKLNEQIIPALQITVPGGVTVDSGTERFNSRMEYEIVVIDRGMVVLHDMYKSMGYEQFLAALREYVSRMRFRNATAADFLAVMNEVSGKRWDEYLYGQMHNMDDFVNAGIEWYE